MRVSVLGATEVWRGDQRVDLGSRKPRALVAALSLYAGRPVSVDTIVDLLWSDSPPETVAGTLQAYISGLRRALEPDRAPRAPATVLRTVEPGYALCVDDDALDAVRFDRTVNEVHRRMGSSAKWWAPPALGTDDLVAVRDQLDEVLALWRGEPYVELEDAAAAVAERARLEELRTVALEDRATVGLALGDHGTVAAELEALTSAYPLRERLWGLRALALVRSGRQADALAALATVRRVLDEELGLEPSAQLRDLQTAVLRQDPGLGPTSAAPAARPSAAPAPVVARPERTAPALPPWPLVGRGAELATLETALEAADRGTPTFAAITGEPGIGKSRLCAELGSRAVARGSRLLLGRCSQDDGAPPLWPWQQVLRGVGAEVDVAPDDDEGAEFRTWVGIVERVVAAARLEPIVLVLDDLHWADTPTLRVLRLLVDSAEAGRLLVVGTWRTHPEPTGALADAAESLARRHAARIELTGLAVEEVGEVVGALSDSHPTQEQVRQLAARTDGNPFFLVEYARLAQDGGDLDDLMAESDPPTAVGDVLTRRLDRLPDPSRSVLRWASVVGRSFDLGTVAHVCEVDEDDVLDALDPAIDAGLVREDGIGRYLFGHALVRDTLYAAISATRRARAHARVAATLDGIDGRETEAAHHWRAAGPAHAGRAWRAAVAAAGVARRLHAYGPAALLLDSALGSLALDAASTPRDRFDVLMELADAQRWRGSWSALLDAVEQAIVVADEIGDVELLARAASAMTIGELWQSPSYGEPHEAVIAALRRALDGLPPEDGELRCRVMVGLADELYYSEGFEERSALIEEGLAMARRLGDDALVVHALLTGFVALWRPSTAPMRLELAREATGIADRAGDERAFALAATLLAVVHGELGQVPQMWSAAALAREPAERLHLPYALVVLDSLELPWLAMAGRFEGGEERLARMAALGADMAMPRVDDTIGGAMANQLVWQGRAGEITPFLADLEEGILPVTATLLMFLIRSGDVESARAHAATHRIPVEADDWFSMLNWAAAAETSLGLADAELGSTAYALLSPFAGRNVSAGSGNALGPVDAFLALAAAAAGDPDVAARHADDALELMAAWEIPLAAQWLREQRDRYGF